MSGAGHLRKPKGKLEKHTLVTYINLECERFLFWSLGRDDPAWVQPGERLRTIGRNIIRPELLLKLGKKYEQEIYRKLGPLVPVICNKSVAGEVSQRIVQPSDFSQIYKDAMAKGTVVLLEHQIDTPRSFLDFVFPAKPGGANPSLVIGDIRPDILVMRKLPAQDGIKELLPGGKVRAVPPSELATRASITIIDIKNVFKDKIGKKQFIEVFHYAYFFAFYLHEHGLDTRFFVNIAGNGIFPNMEATDLAAIATFGQFSSKVVGIRWAESQRIFVAAIKKIQDLWLKVPCPVDSIPAKMQPSCAYCLFVQDCKERFGYAMGQTIESCAVDLIPFTSTSIKEQLKELGMKTIGDVARGIVAASSGMNPDPLLAEKPILKLKADALIQQRLVPPAPGAVHSYLLPKYTPTTIIFDCESDPAHDHVYVVGILLDASNPRGSLFGERYDAWWATWDSALKARKTPVQIKEDLDTVLLLPISLAQVESFKAALDTLSEYQLVPPRVDSFGQTTSHARFAYVHSFLSIELDHDHELGLLKKFIHILHAVLTIGTILEIHAVSEGFTAGKFLGPDVGVFYWSEDQLDNFQLMLERHLDHVIADTATRDKYTQIIQWFTPTESEVTHPYQQKKIYDLKAFAQTAIGLPSVVNYTWHDIAHALFKDFKISWNYWISHYDHLNFLYWHRFLLQQDTAEKMKQHGYLIRQVMHKLRTLDRLRIEFQKSARDSISDHAKPATGAEYRAVIPGPDIHDVAHVWYMHSRLNGVTAEMDAIFMRTTFPDYAIGKLEAAEISPPRKRVDPGERFHFEFDITGQSVNSKNIKEGDTLYIIPDEMRDGLSGKGAWKWQLKIDTMNWTPAIKGYTAITEVTPNDVLDQFSTLHEDGALPTSVRWFAYPWEADYWSPKLFGPDDCLFARHNFGTTWLGRALAWDWGIRSSPSLSWPSSWTFMTHEIYMFAPFLLTSAKVRKGAPLDPARFISSLKARPDDSQLAAINLALHEVISGIQGPPGTGKSQTITALLNECHARRMVAGKTGTRILITAFSYAALRVLVKKILDSQDASGSPSEISKFQLVYVRSDREDPIPDARITDLVKIRKTWFWAGESGTVTPTNHLEHKLEPNCVIFANAFSLYNIHDRVDEGFSFDLIIVDEASQLPVSFFLSSLQYVNHVTMDIQVKAGMRADPDAPVPPDIEAFKALELAREVDADDLTRVVVVGDYNQLPPVSQVKPPENLRNVLESLFSYYVRTHEIPNIQLLYNYRSHEDIVAFTKEIGIYKDLKANPNKALATKTLEGNIGALKDAWLEDVLDPAKVVTTLIHERQHEIAVSTLEVELVTSLIFGYYDMVAPATPQAEEHFWKDKVGIVAPHNAQGRAIIQHVFSQLTGPGGRHTRLPPGQLMGLLKTSIYSVEKFQGSDRDLIIASYGVSDKDQIAAEEEFLYDLNRFNVLTSRAKHKVVVICSKSLLDHIPSDRDVMDAAGKLQLYALDFCGNATTILPTNELGGIEQVELRWHGHGTPVDDRFEVAVTRADGKVTVIVPAHARYLPLFRALPGTIQKRSIGSGTSTETWEFDARDLPAIKAHVPIPPAWLRKGPGAAPTTPSPKPQAPPKIKRGTIGL